MRRKQTGYSFKLHLLGLVLALALLWYSLNPAPGHVSIKKPEAEPPDEKKRSVEPQSMTGKIPLIFRQMGDAQRPLPSPVEAEDDFEWPDFIDG